MLPRTIPPFLTAMRNSLLAFAVAALLSAPLAVAEAPDTEAEARAALESFVRSVTTLETAFTQVQHDEFGDELGESEGRFWLQRPGRFRWEVTAPHEQVVVADGESLWFYDPDLRQATRRPSAQALLGTPAALLAEDAELGDAYRVALLDRETDNGDSDAVRVRLAPKKDGDAEFRSLTLTLVDDVPRAIAFEDQLGGMTEVRFEGIKVNEAVDAERLRFDPPEGTDVIEVE